MDMDLDIKTNCSRSVLDLHIDIQIWSKFILNRSKFDPIRFKSYESWIKSNPLPSLGQGKRAETQMQLVTGWSWAEIGDVAQIYKWEWVEEDRLQLNKGQ